MCTMPHMGDPFWLIVAFIAIACLALYPIRRWRQAHHRYEPDDSDEES